MVKHMPYAKGRIYRFPDRRPPSSRFTVRDRLDLHAAGERITAAGLRCVIGRETGELPHDFLTLIPLGGSQPSWTLVPARGWVRVWRDGAGKDLGTFASMAEALAAALSSGLASSTLDRAAVQR